MHPRLSDRFDQALECVRAHYARERRPLTSVLARYWEFFELFGSFDEYVEFWLVQDLVDGPAIRFYLPFDGFVRRAVPSDLGEYEAYRLRSLAFIDARGARMAASVKSAG